MVCIGKCSMVQGYKIFLKSYIYFNLEKISKILLYGV